MDRHFYPALLSPKSLFIEQHGLLDQEGFVDLMYANILEREAEAAGKAYWVEKLDAGVEQGVVMVGIAESEESLALFV